MQKYNAEIKQIYQTAMDKLTHSRLSKIQELIQSQRENSTLTLKIVFNSHQNLQKIINIEKQLKNHSHITDLSLNISKQSVLTEHGYRILSNAVLNLHYLKKLSIKIDEQCYLECIGIRILQDSINRLPQLVYLKLVIAKNNYIKAETAQEFLDSLTENINLNTLKLHFEDIQSSSVNQGNIHFWRGLQNLINIEKLVLKLNHNNYGYCDLIELFTHIADLKILRKLSLDFIESQIEAGRILDDLFPQIGQMVELRSLKIDCKIYDYTVSFNENQIQRIIRNLSNLQLLENLKLNQLKQLLIYFNYQEYIQLIRNMKHLRAVSLVIPSKNKEGDHNEILLFSQSINEFKNLVHFDFVLEQEDNNVWRSFFLDLSVSFRQLSNLLSLKLVFRRKISQEGCINIGKLLSHLPQLEKLKLRIMTTGFYRKMLDSIRCLRNLKELELDIEENWSQKIEEKEQIIIQSTSELLISISRLNQLERLSLRLDHIYTCLSERIKLIDQFCSTLKNLRKLEHLECRLYIHNAENQKQLEQLEESFKNLTQLKDLILFLNIQENNNKDLQDISLIEHLTNLKKIKIEFDQFPLNIFSSSGNRIQQLEECELVFNKMTMKIIPLQLIEILNSLSSSPIKKLSLDGSFTRNFLEHYEQFALVCSKFNRLEKLSIFVNARNELLTYIEGIKEMKSLKSLKISSNDYQLTSTDAFLFYYTLKQLYQLQKLKLFFLPKNQINGDVRDIFNFDALHQFKNLRHLQISDLRILKKWWQISPYSWEQEQNSKLINTFYEKNYSQLMITQPPPNFNDSKHEHFNSSIDIRNVFCIDLHQSKAPQNYGKVIKHQQSNQTFTNVANLHQQNPLLFKSLFLKIKNKQIKPNQSKTILTHKEFNQNNNEFSQNKKEFSQNKKEFSQNKKEFSQTNIKVNQINNEYNQSEISINISNFTRSKMELTLENGLDFLHSKYLNKLSFTFDTYEGQLELRLPLRDLNCESKLVNLSLNLKGFIFNEDQISYFSRNMRYLTNLESLEFISDEMNNYYHSLFSSFSYLTNLRSLTVNTKMYYQEAISLGKSLKSMKKLQMCKLIFTKKSYLGIKGISSILRGLHNITKLKKFKLKMYSSKYKDIYSCRLPQLPKCFITNQKFLWYLELCFYFDHVEQNCLREFLTSISSLVFLRKLVLIMDKTNPFCQDMVDVFIQVVIQLELLRYVGVKIHLENNKQIKLSKRFATLFNRLSNSQLAITTPSKGGMHLKQDSCVFELDSENLDNLELDFLEYLNENKEVIINFEDLKLLNNIKSCAARKLTLQLKSKQDKKQQENIDYLCQFLPKNKNIFELKINTYLGSSNIQDQITNLTSSLTKLSTLKVLNLQLLGRKVNQHKLMQILKGLKSMKQLQGLYLKSERDISEKMIPCIQRAILRLVKFNKSTQVNFKYW